MVSTRVSVAALGVLFTCAGCHLILPYTSATVDATSNSAHDSAPENSAKDAGGRDAPQKDAPQEDAPQKDAPQKDAPGNDTVQPLKDLAAVDKNLLQSDGTVLCKTWALKYSSPAVDAGNGYYDWVTHQTLPAVLSFSADFTVGAWIKPSDISWERHIISKHSHYIKRGYVLLTRFGVPEFRVYFKNATYCAAKTVTAMIKNSGAWIHLAGSFDGYTVRLFVNGKRVDENSCNASSSHQINHLPGGMRIGNPAYNDHFPFQGIIDDVLIMNIARKKDFDPVQVYQLGCAGVVARYPFNEGAGQVSASSCPGTGLGLILGSTSGGDPNDPTWVKTECIHDR